jgi:hypothetical protein
MNRPLRPKVWTHRLVALSSHHHNAFPGPAQSPEQPPDFINLAKNHIAVFEKWVLPWLGIMPEQVVADPAKRVSIHRAISHD